MIYVTPFLLKSYSKFNEQVEKLNIEKKTTEQRVSSPSFSGVGPWWGTCRLDKTSPLGQGVTTEQLWNMRSCMLQCKQVNRRYYLHLVTPGSACV